MFKMCVYEWMLWIFGWSTIFSDICCVTLMCTQHKIMFLWEFCITRRQIICSQKNMPISYIKTFTKIHSYWKHILTFPTLNYLFFIINIFLMNINLSGIIFRVYEHPKYHYNGFLNIWHVGSFMTFTR